MELICKKCLLREMAEADAAMIKKYVDAIKGEDRVPEKEYEARPVSYTHLDVYKRQILMSSSDA